MSAELLASSIAIGFALNFPPKRIQYFIMVAALSAIITGLILLYVLTPPSNSGFNWVAFVYGFAGYFVGRFTAKGVRASLGVNWE